MNKIDLFLSGYIIRPGTHCIRKKHSSVIMAAAEKNKRASFSMLEKSEIAKYGERYSTKSQQEIADHFSTVWKKPVKRRTVGDILKDKQKWISGANDSARGQSSKRVRSAKYEAMEKALFLWFTSARAKNIPMSEDVLRTKAKYFGRELGVDEGFQYSHGWVDRFKKRFAISGKKLSGESAGVDGETVLAGIQKAREIIKKFAPKDVYNMDETGLFYQMLPDRSLTTSEFVKGTKKAKQRVSVAVCANADGSDKLKLLVIGKSKKPRCFKQMNVGHYCDYRFNTKAWMTGLLFNEWLEDFNSLMRSRNRHVLLLLDNAPSHLLPEDEDGKPALSNVTIHFLPPNTTSHLQPMDAGIIQNMKVHYRRMQVQYLVDRIDSNRPPKLELSDAVRFVKSAWDSVTPETIRNCFRHTKTMPPEWFVQDENVDNQSETGASEPSNNNTPLSRAVERGNLFERLAQVFNIAPETIMTPDEFVNVDRHEPATEVLDDNEILDLVREAEDDDNDPDSSSADENGDTYKPPTHFEARMALETLCRFFDARENSVESDIVMLSKLRCTMDSVSLKQSSIKDFFGPSASNNQDTNVQTNATTSTPVEMVIDD